ncbi:hypothetical protein CL656_07110 [bacterium]|nr:hypothetical protein [bacterium]
MPGGLLNIIAYGNQNVFLNNNPSKTLFKCVYAKYTNFGIQKFRVDYSGLKELRLNESSEFTFKIPRYGDLLLDNYLVIQLPDIWSPIYPPQNLSDTWKPYEFKWIKNLGAICIEELSFNIGGQIIQKYTGEYIYNLKQRDFTDKINIFDQMIGNTSDLNEPEKYLNRNGNYPNAYYDDSMEGSEPSIRGKRLYIPLCSYFSFTSKMAFPLVCLQYNELTINIKIRPLKELFTINDITNITQNKYARIQPHFNETEHAFYRFLQQPPSVELKASDYENKNTSFNSDIHLISTYAFLTEDETKVFASNEQKFLLKEVRETTFRNVINSQKLKLESNGMVPSWMWFLRRTDSYIRNEWTNYTNYAYENEIPSNVTNESDTILNTPVDSIEKMYVNGPSYDSNGLSTGIKISGTYNVENMKNILTKFAIIFDGKYRENDLNADIYNTVEKYRNSNGKSGPGLYEYNFCMMTSPYEIQPSGAINLTKFRNIEFELTTITPPLNKDAETLNICTDDGELIGVNKTTWDIYNYSYDLVLFEERYNILHFINGNAGLMYSI